MIKGKLIESIRGYLTAQEPTQDGNGKVNFQRINVACDQVFTTMLNASFVDDPKGMETNYVTYYSNKLMKRLNGYNYLDIDAKFVELPKGKGIWFVKPHGSKYPLPKSSTHHAGILDSLPIGEITNNSVYKVGNIPNVEGRKIIIEHIGDSIYAATTRYDYALVKAFSEYGDDEDVLVPNGRYDVFINQVLQWFGKRIDDKSNNNQ